MSYYWSIPEQINILRVVQANWSWIRVSGSNLFTCFWYCQNFNYFIFVTISLFASRCLFRCLVDWGVRGSRFLPFFVWNWIWRIRKVIFILDFLLYGCISLLVWGWGWLWEGSCLLGVPARWNWIYCVCVKDPIGGRVQASSW